MNNKFKLFCLLFLSNWAGCAFADLIVEDAYVRGPLPGVNTISAYMKLSNTGDIALELTGATSVVANNIMLHTTITQNGLLQMQHVMKSIIPAHSSLLLESGGLHFMLTGVNANLNVGSEVEIILEFSDGKTHHLMLPVRSVLDE